METVSLSDVRTRLAEYVERAERHNEQFIITRRGLPIVVIMSAAEWASAQDAVAASPRTEQVKAANPT